VIEAMADTERVVVVVVRVTVVIHTTQIIVPAGIVVGPGRSEPIVSPLTSSQLYPFSFYFFIFFFSYK